VAAHIRQGLAGQLDDVAGPAPEPGRHLGVDLGDGHHLAALAEVLDQPVQA
jgi:hypothetical protein